MKTKINHVIDPMLERTPEAFHKPNTIPTGWDMSEFFEPTQSAPKLQSKAAAQTTAQAPRNEAGWGELSV